MLIEWHLTDTVTSAKIINILAKNQREDGRTTTTETKSKADKQEQFQSDEEQETVSISQFELWIYWKILRISWMERVTNNHHD